ncbi:MAG: ABC transporter ATP-binding protein/permease [Eubacterium sp.]|nr:ABC transporter ATP-binding protein/permease [Eubacterium sp.]
MIQIKNLQKYYNQGKKNEQHVLNDITLEFPSTGLICILGESGSGKTTLLNTVGGLDTFSGGSITIDDKELKKYDPRVMEPIRNNSFDYIFQNYYLLKDYSVSYNIKLALNRYDLTEEEKEERVDYVLNTLGIGKYKKKTVSKLSGGQQQRVSIARALVKSPDVIFADEPTGNLDEENTIRTMSILKNISKECLVLLVTHEKRIARFFGDRIIEVCDGRIVKDEPNIPADSYERSDDANIYLKELEQKDLSGELAEFHMFQHKHAVPHKIELTLAWKDDKLYIQNNMPYDILIEGVENGVQILDEERPTLDLENVDEFSYELPKLESKGSARLSGREILRMAVENLQLMGKKQAFVISILLVTAVLLSITLAQFINAHTIDPSAVIATDSHYVLVDFSGTTSFRGYDAREQLNEYIQTTLTSNKEAEPFFVPKVNVYLTGGGFKQLTKLTQMIQDYSFVSKTHLNESDLICGEMPKKRNDVVMDRLLAERLIHTKASVSTQHPTPESFLGMTLVMSAVSQEFHVVGISDTEQPVMYCGQNVLLGVNTKGYSIADIAELQAEAPNSYKDLTLDKDEVMVRQGLYDSMDLGADGTISLGEDFQHSFKIVDTFPDNIGVDYILSDEGCINIRNMMIYENMTCLLYAQDPAKTAAYYKKNENNLGYVYEAQISIPSENELKAYKEAHSSDMDAKQLIPLAVAVISLIMVYFTIKSNAASRSEELTVYRLIGISRGSILKAYMLEMALVTTYTSLPAVLITSGVIQFIGSIPSLETNMAFPWWSALLLVACIYAVHIFISILPVYGILSRPPATLAVKE